MLKQSKMSAFKLCTEKSSTLKATSLSRKESEGNYINFLKKNQARSSKRTPNTGK